MKCQQIEGDAVVHLARARGILETELGKRVYRVFDSPPLIGTLRDLVGLAIEQIVVFGLVSAKTMDQYNQALRVAGKDLAAWKGRSSTVWSLKSVLREKDTWSAGDCSDLIRLFAGVIEQESLQQAGQVGRDVDQFRLDQRQRRCARPGSSTPRLSGGRHAAPG